MALARSAFPPLAKSHYQIDLVSNFRIPEQGGDRSIGGFGLMLREPLAPKTFWTV